jgi:hypothetical protein
MAVRAAGSRSTICLRKRLLSTVMAVQFSATIRAHRYGSGEFEVNVSPRLFRRHG